MGSVNRRNSAFNEERNHKIKLPCVLCSGPRHGIWSFRLFEQKSVEDQWKFAKEKQLCFRCLSKDYREKDCQRSQPCKVNGFHLKHHRLLHRSAMIPPSTDLPGSQDAPREGAPPLNKVAMTTQNQTLSEQCFF